MLNKTQLAALFRFAADLLLQDEANAIPALAPNTGTAENNLPATKRPGRPRKTDQPVNEPQQALPAEPETKVEQPAPIPEPEKPKFTTEEILVKLRAIINPLVVKARGPDVQEVINKHAPADFNVSDSNKYTLALLAEHPEKHDAFEQDIKALRTKLLI